MIHPYENFVRTGYMNSHLISNTCSLGSNLKQCPNKQQFKTQYKAQVVLGYRDEVEEWRSQGVE